LECLILSLFSYVINQAAYAGGMAIGNFLHGIAGDVPAPNGVIDARTSIDDLIPFVRELSLSYSLSCLF
jgi:hypothetical protein